MLQRGWFLVVLSVVACKPPEKPRPPEHDDAPERRSNPNIEAPTSSTIPTTPPEGFATADFVTMTGGELAAYAVKDNKLVRSGAVTLVELDPNDDETRFLGHIGDGDFVDREHLFLQIGPRIVVQVTSTSIAKVAVPKPAEMTAPRPPKNDNPDSGPGGHDGRLFATDSQIWWSECAWGFAADGFQCEVHVNAELWPKPHIEEDRSAPQPRGFVWPTVPPPGFSVRNVTRDYRDTGVVCEPPKAQGSKVTIFAETSTDESIIGTTWVSQTPPRLLVIYGHAGYADLIPDRWTLHAGCTQQTLATGTVVEPGPNGLWIAKSGEDANRKLFIYRGGDVLGELSPHSSVLFRPTTTTTSH